MKNSKETGYYRPSCLSLWRSFFSRISVCSLWHWIFHSSSKLASWQSVAIAENILQQAWNCWLHFPDIWELLCQWCELDLFSILWELRMCLSTCCLIELVSLPQCSHLQLCLGCTQCIYAHFRFPPYFVQNKTVRVLDWLFSLDEEASYILTQGAHLQLCLLDCQNFLILSQLLQCVSLWDPEGWRYHSKCDLVCFSIFWSHLVKMEPWVSHILYFTPDKETKKASI